MFKIILKNLLKNKYFIIPFILFWLLSGIVIYNYRYSFLSFLYRVSSGFPEFGQENPKKAYENFVQPALEILEKNQVNLILLKEFCPKQIQSEILFNTEYEWHFLKKYNIFYFESKYIFGKSYEYWKQKKEFVLEVINLLKKGQKYAIEIPAEITAEKKTILIPLLLDQALEAICLPNESRKNWAEYIRYIEQSFYSKGTLFKQEKELRLHPFPSEFDIDLLNVLQNNEKYIFSIYKYIGSSVPFEYLHFCPEEKFLCSQLEEANFYYNKLAFVYPYENLGEIFLNHARIYFYLGMQTKNQNYFHLALDRYAGAKDYRNSFVDAYLEMIYLFLVLNQPAEALYKIEEFKAVKPKNFFQETIYFDLVYKTLTYLGYFQEADCFKKNAIDSRECKEIRDRF